MKEAFIEGDVVPYILLHDLGLQVEGVEMREVETLSLREASRASS